MKKIDLDIIPLVISLILIMVSIVVISTSNYTLSLKQYVGFGCLILSIFFYFKKRTTYYIVFGLTLLVGIFGLLDFYYRTYEIGFGSFGINPVFVILLILHFAFAFQIADKIDANK